MCPTGRCVDARHTGGILVGVVEVATALAPEVFPVAVLRIGVPARRARLRRVGGGDKYHGSSGRFEDVLHLGARESPQRSAHGLVQFGLRTDVGDTTALGTCAHGNDVKGLKSEDVPSQREFASRLAYGVVVSIAHRAPQVSESVEEQGRLAGPFFTSRHLALEPDACLKELIMLWEG